MLVAAVASFAFAVLASTQTPEPAFTPGANAYLAPNQPHWTQLPAEDFPAPVSELDFPNRTLISARHSAQFGSWTISVDPSKPPVALMPGGDCAPVIGLHESCDLEIDGLTCTYANEAPVACSMHLEWSYWVDEYHCNLSASSQSVPMQYCPEGRFLIGGRVVSP
ncbi:MAG TPA: hypothetical protein VIN40_04435 [Candidatus Tyrphobacter sp.]